jgi:glycosyltransferase involved in cell wall biosynthesis
VADAGSTDGTPEVVMGFRDRLQVEVIPGEMPAVGRNSGAALAQTPYVLFLEADVELASDTLIRRAMESAREKDLHCVITNILCLGAAA